MFTRRISIRLRLAAAVLAATTAVALAQTTTPMHPNGQMLPPTAPGMPMAGHPGQGGPGMEMRGGMMGMGMMGRGHEGRGEGRGGMGMGFDHVEGRIAYLRAELKITDAQSAPWTAYADNMRAEAGAMKSMHDGMMKGTMPVSTPDRMARMHEMMTARLAMMDKSEGVTKTLYAALSSEQKKSFDQMMMGPMGMM